LVIWEWFQKQPIIDVRLFKNVNFAAASVMFFILGVILFGSTAPQPALGPDWMPGGCRSPRTDSAQALPGKPGGQL